jgi:hypothetical protein
VGVQDDKPVDKTELKSVMSEEALVKQHVKVAKQPVKNAEQICVILADKDGKTARCAE